ncbi:MAG: ACT domain-containing protein [Candidatus Moranbacteria bacterium]|nr:ACT domain-containing protein [Candidatus Moranbacteria bacterium]
MLLKQISIFIENKSGRLAEITKLFGEKGINILALSIADTTDFGILRLIVSDPDEAEKIVKENGLTAKATDVIGISIPHVPGGLAQALSVLNDKSIGIEYMYAFATRSEENAMVILKVADNFSAMKFLTDAQIKILSKEDIASLF